jgi:hypothetical protein
MGGVAPNGQASIAPNDTGGWSSAANSQAIGSGFQANGSGIQAAGWTETGASNSQGFNQNAAAQPNPRGQEFGLNPTSANTFRQGGMQVNDLTAAPSPPGYRPPPGNPNPAFNPIAPQNFNQQGFGTQNVAPRTIQTPTAREFAGAIAPGPSSVIAQSPNTSLNSVGNLVPVNSGGDPRFPSTNPVGGTNPTGSSQNTLDWRTPGTQF